MEHEVSEERFERALVLHAAATLLGAKAASMFTVRGSMGCSCTGCDEHDDASELSPAQMRDMARRRARLEAIVRRYHQVLAHRGVCVTVLAWRSYGALVYVWRPVLLAARLRDVRVARALSEQGYQLDFTAPDQVLSYAAIDQVSERFCRERLPHEIGFFLDYPYEDVRGFIEHQGRDFICCGAWKVYADARGAVRRFARYKRCVRRCERLWRDGATVFEIAGPPPQALSA